MIGTALLKGLAFPWLLVDANFTLIEEGDGALFRQPEANAAVALEACGGLSIGGWGVASDGYAVFRFATQAIAPLSLVLYGLKINGLATARGRTGGLSIRLDREELQRYIADFCSGMEALDDNYRTMIRENIHEIRGINAALYHTALQLKTLIDSNSQDSDGSRIAKSVVRWVELLTGRIDFMDFIANPGAVDISKSEISVYKKFDKVQRCFRVTANQKNVRISMSGFSSGTVFGPPIFDIAPYLLLDNAVKYSPNGRSVSIQCNDSYGRVVCRVESVGPRIKDSELKGIFSPAVRGENAVKSGKTGSGLGLAVLDRIVRTVFDGEVRVTQDPSSEYIGSVPYTEVCFEISVPVHRRSAV